MPLTPRFEISQSPTQVVVTVQVPNIRINNETMEILLEEETSILHFYASPYLLKLNFHPHQFVDTQEDGLVSAKYDPSLQTVAIPLIKKVPNVEWPNLEFTARLVEATPIPKKWLHAVVTNDDDAKEGKTATSTTTTSNKGSENEERRATKHEGDDGASIDIPIMATADEDGTVGYGFGNIFKNIFVDYCRGGLAIEMLQLKESPETTTPTARRNLRLQKEKEDFDADRYLQDLCIEQEDYMHPMVMEFVPAYFQNKNDDEITPTTNPTTTASSSSSFTSEEQLQLATIPYPLIPDHFLKDYDPHHSKSLMIGLLDILAAFVYDHLTTMGDPTVESAWTIVTLSSTLSWLDPPTNMTTISVKDAVISSSRRMLIYPYWRNWDFNMYVWKHVRTMLGLEKGTSPKAATILATLIQSLLKVRKILDTSESYYLHNKLFIDPYLYWLQNADTTMMETLLEWFRNSLEKVFGIGHGDTEHQLHKEDLGLELGQYEAMLFSEEDNEEDESSTSSCDSSIGDDDSEESSTASSSGDSATAGNKDELDFGKDSVDAEGDESRTPQTENKVEVEVDTNFSSSTVETPRHGKDSNKNIASSVSQSLLELEHIDHGMSMLEIVGQTISGSSQNPETPIPTTTTKTTETSRKDNHTKSRPLIMEMK